MDDFPIEGSSVDPAGEGSAPASATGRDAGRGLAGDTLGDDAAGRGTPAGGRRDPGYFAFDETGGEPPDEQIPDSRARRTEASSRRWRNIALVLGLVAAILAGATGKLLFAAMNRGSSSTASPGTSVATASPLPASPTPAMTGSATLSPTATGGATETPGPSSTASATETPGPSSTAGASSTPMGTTTPAPQASGPASPATITFHQMMLDSEADPSGTARTFAFTTDGPGSVSAEVAAAAPLANLKMCIQVNGGPQSCTTGATPGFFTMAPSSGDQAQWVVTLIATDAGATPVVDVAFTWQTRAPAITLSGGRFQGAPNPDSLRGFTATFKTRAAGSVGLIASWPPVSTDATLTLTDVTSSPGSAVGQATYPATGSITPAYTHAVAAGRTYQIQVLNAGSDSGRPDLTTTISFP